MKLNKINIAVIGYGNMGSFHISKYLQMDHVNLVGICDVGSSETSKEIDGQTVAMFDDLDKLLSECDVTAVSITSPTYTHFEIAKKCLNLGIHCLIEKPIATSEEEASELIEIATHQGLVLTVGHIERFNPAVLAVKQCIKEDLLGPIASISFRRNGPFPKQIDDADVVIDLAVHDIDIANYWLDALPDATSGHKSSLITGGRPDHAEILAKYGQTHVFFQVNWITPKRVRNAVITGKKGYIEMDFIAQTVELYPCQTVIKPK